MLAAVRQKYGVRRILAARNVHVAFLNACTLLDMDVAERNEVIVKMAEHGIACNVHYKPLPMMTAYKALGFDITNYPNAYNQYRNEVTLPLHTRLTNEDVEFVISNFVDIISR